MNFKYLLLILLVINGFLFSQIKYPKDEVQVNYVEHIRTVFYDAIEDDDINDKFLDYIKDAIKKSGGKEYAFFTAYYGASETLVAKHSYNPYTKLKYLNIGLKKISSAIKKFPESLELRFLRFSILHYIPSFLGYSSERNEDLGVIYKLLLEKDYSEVAQSIQQGIINFLIESDRLKDTELKRLEVLMVAKK